MFYLLGYERVCEVQQRHEVVLERVQSHDDSPDVFAKGREDVKVVVSDEVRACGGGREKNRNRNE